MICPECHAPVYPVGHEITCSGCGLVLNDTVYQPSKVELFEFGIALGGSIQGQRRIIQTDFVVNYVCHNSSYDRGYKTIHAIKQYLELPPSILYRAQYLYRTQFHRIPVTFNFVFAATCVYTAVREVSFPILIDDIIEYYRARGHVISRQSVFRMIRDYFEKIPFDVTKQMRNWINRHFTTIIYSPIIQEEFSMFNHHRSFADWAADMNKMIGTIYKLIMPKVRRMAVMPSSLALGIVHTAARFLIQYRFFLTQPLCIRVCSAIARGIRFQYYTHIRPNLGDYMYAQTYSKSLSTDNDQITAPSFDSA